MVPHCGLTDDCARARSLTQVRRTVEGRQNAWQRCQDGSARCVCPLPHAINHLCASREAIGGPRKPTHHARAPPASAGNLFEGEWKEGKPIVKNSDREAAGGPLDWLNEAVANVSTSLSGQGGGGNYASVSTHDDDEDDWRRPSHR